MPTRELDEPGAPVSDWREDPWDASLGAGEVEPLRSQSRVGKWVGFGLLILAHLLIIGGGIYGWWYIRQANPPGDAGAVVPFEVAEGETLADVSARLEDEGIITNAGFFRSYADDHGGLEAIEPGLYLLRPGDHVGNIMSRLRTSPSETTTRVTFPEGYTLQQMANRLADQEQLPQFSAEDFMAAANDPTIPATFRPAGVTSLEGLLFPATYEISNADTERQIVERMVDAMERVGEQEAITAPETAGYTPYQILIIASMIEREARTERDRPLIARVIYNRLAEGWSLNIDATVLYGHDPAVLEQRGIDLSDLQPGDIDTLRTLDTPWNTYTRAGWPQTPIANPGRASIDAALNPAPNPSAGEAVCQNVPPEQACRYMYYVLADDQGNHSFWVTEEQFNVAVQEASDAGLLGAGD